MSLTLSTSVRVLRGPSVVVRSCHVGARQIQTKTKQSPANPWERPSLPFLRWEKQGRATEHAALLPPIGLAAISE
ncbi:hypothetical protein KVT40_001082 [Elsinoe batatas]|uniref:Uncharacterized protein n=1 Tax=Elsinoe batatas TaxID=2601811 RepID=A0A8K0L9X0_9PEZI|nr:hypothetical protein KVT40_001082 [Elsinoe batatas]